MLDDTSREKLGNDPNESFPSLEKQLTVSQRETE
jgi:hypothetical protein